VEKCGTARQTTDNKKYDTGEM
jgi:hypothetical protein